jgi:transposase
MSRTRSSRSRPARKPFVLQKPNGVLIPRVQAVGPEHFGVLGVDCAKERSRYLLADYYGQVLLEPTTLPHSQGDFQAAITRLREAMVQFDLRDVVVAIERTGDYHRPVQHAYRQAHFDTRLVHPLTSKQYRQPADPENKSDDTDLAAIVRATTHGFALLDPTWPDDYRTIQLLRRHRRDVVDKNACLYCQIREVLHAAMPGYAECFCHLWETPTPLVLARHTTSAQAVLDAGFSGLQRIVQEAGISCRRDTLDKVLAWARQAPPGHSLPLVQRRLLAELDDDRLAKTRQIAELERDLAHLVVRTPYALLLAIPGINIVTVADLAGEAGPIYFYLNANGLTGRAGLMPSRYKSDQVDLANGPLRRRGNRRLRAVLMQTADNLIQCNHHFKARAEQWQRLDKDPRWIRVKIAKIFSRLTFAIVAGGHLFPHPCMQPRHYLLGKLMAFHTEHRTPLDVMRQDLEALVDQLPTQARADEVEPLQKQLDDMANRRRGPQPLADIIPLVLARLGAPVLQSPERRERDPN